jgi:hypothetical protein
MLSADCLVGAKEPGTATEGSEKSARWTAEGQLLSQCSLLGLGSSSFPELCAKAALGDGPLRLGIIESKALDWRSRLSLQGGQWAGDPWVAWDRVSQGVTICGVLGASEEKEGRYQASLLVAY